jgi:hypothetical protein
MSLASYPPLTEITAIALRVLIQEMGIVNTIRFLNQFHTGYGDYTRDKDLLFAQLSVEDIAQAIIKQQAQAQAE